jgi:aspartate kinase
MKVFKFGGASIADAYCIRNIGGIIKTYQNEKLLIVVSALGKTTNAIEKVVNAFTQNNLVEATQLFQFLEIEHNALAQDLLPEQEAKICIEHLQNIYAEADWILHDAPVREYDYYYDQLVCLGELMSTTLLQHYFVSIGIKSVWQDVRDVFRTDTIWREANIDMEVTQQNIDKIIVPMIATFDVMITQDL